MITVSYYTWIAIMERRVTEEKVDKKSECITGHGNWSIPKCSIIVQKEENRNQKVE